MIAFIGSACWDRLYRIDQPLQNGHRANVEELIEGPGGGELNSATWAASLGVETLLVAQRGEDREGALLAEHLADTDRLTVEWMLSSRPTKGSTVIIDEHSERTILRHVAYPLSPTSIPLEIAYSVADADLVWIRHFDPHYRALAHDLVPSGARAATRLRDIEEELSAGRSWQIAVDSASECPHPSDQLLSDSGLEICVLTEGGNGGSVWTPDQGWCRYAPATPAGAVVDSTGAGDSFLAGFMVGLDRGLSPLQAAELGAQCGARAVTAIGAWPR